MRSKRVWSAMRNSSSPAICASHLRQVCDALNGKAVLPAAAGSADLADLAKRANLGDASNLPPDLTRSADAPDLAGTAISRLGLSARACHRVLKLARTCADLAGHPEIRRNDVAEAVQLRAL